MKERIQTCTSVLSSPHFDDEIDYVPNLSNSPKDCNKYEVALSKDEFGKYEEWMMQCVAVSSETDLPIIFYLSRGYSPHKVFLFRSESVTTAEVIQEENLSESNTAGEGSDAEKILEPNSTEKGLHEENLSQPDISTEKIVIVENLCVNVRNVTE